MQKLHELIINNLIEEKLSEKGKLLIKYAESKKHPFPDLDPWGKLCNLLVTENKINKHEFPVPLILSGWAYSENWEKAIRFKEQILWADEAKLIDFVDSYLRDLQDSDWYLNF